MNKQDFKDFGSSTKSQICDNVQVEGDIKDHCCATGNYRGPVHRDCNIKDNLNHKIPALFHNLKNCNSHLIMQELGNFNFKINGI